MLRRFSAKLKGFLLPWLLLVALFSAPTILAVEKNSSASIKITRLNLNTASAAELAALPGLGKARAEAIIRWRENYGPFRSLEDLRQIKGFGATTLQEMRDYLEVPPISQ